MRRFQRQPSHVNRRQFIAATSAVAGGLIIGFRPVTAIAQASATAAPSPNPFDGYIRIGADNRVTVLCAHMEGGQGIHTGIATLVAEELGADWSQISMEAASGSPALYGNLVFGGTYQLTAGSTGLSSSWQRYRRAGAVARTLLTKAAAVAWGVPAGEIEVAAGELSHSSGMHGKFADFIQEAATMSPPQHVELKQADDWTLIGNDGLRRPDTAGKTRGQQDYTIGVQLPGMLKNKVSRIRCQIYFSPQINKSDTFIRHPKFFRSPDDHRRRRAGPVVALRWQLPYRICR